MPSLRVPVEHYMSSPVHFVHPDVDLDTAQARLSGLRISSLAVVDRAGANDPDDAFFWFHVDLFLGVSDPQLGLDIDTTALVLHRLHHNGDSR